MLSDSVTPMPVVTTTQFATTSTTTFYSVVGGSVITPGPNPPPYQVAQGGESTVPPYASACGGAPRYLSACSCIGVTSPVATVTLTTTVRDPDRSFEGTEMKGPRSEVWALKLLLFQFPFRPTGLLIRQRGRLHPPPPSTLRRGQRSPPAAVRLLSITDLRRTLSSHLPC